MTTLASIAVTRSRRRRTNMHAWCRRTAVIVTMLVAIPWTAVAADKSTKTSGHTTTVSATVGAAAKVNINTATVKELMTLSGIGRTVAERIVAYRAAHGPFTKVEDLRKVEGVGKGLWDRNRARIVTK
jgi:competence protein ComEA